MIKNKLVLTIIHKEQQQTRAKIIYAATAVNNYNKVLDVLSLRSEDIKTFTSFYWQVLLVRMYISPRHMQCKYMW